MKIGIALGLYALSDVYSFLGFGRMARWTTALAVRADIADLRRRIQESNERLDRAEAWQIRLDFERHPPP